MMAESGKVTVTCVMPDGNVREERYDAPAMRRMAFDVYGGDALTDDPGERGFFHGFAAALDVMASGMMSQVYPLGCAVRALADVKDPGALPGEITDVARYAGPGEGYR